MSSTWGTNIKISIFGESHSKGIGVVIDGIPAGTRLDPERLLHFLARRSSRGGKLDTPRIEKDFPQIISGLLPDEGHPGYMIACGTPVCALIENGNTQSKDYEQLRAVARPGHADYTGFVRYHGCNDIRGGGHFSGRLTAPLCFAGGIAKQYLRGFGIEVGAHIASIGSVQDKPFDPVSIEPDTLLAVQEKFFPVLDDKAGERMQKLIEHCRDQLDSDVRLRGKQNFLPAVRHPCGQRGGVRPWIRPFLAAGQPGKRPVLHPGKRRLQQGGADRYQPQRRHPGRHHRRDAGHLPRGHQAHPLDCAEAADGQL